MVRPSPLSVLKPTKLQIGLWKSLKTFVVKGRCSQIACGEYRMPCHMAFMHPAGKSYNVVQWSSLNPCISHNQPISVNKLEEEKHFHFRQHEYSHTGETPFECKIPGDSIDLTKNIFIYFFADCDKKFTSKFKLKRHILIHSQTKTFLCDVCHRAFRRKDHLRNHEKVHDPGKTIYTCTYDTCARTYNSVTSFRKHQVSWVTKVGSQKSSQFCFSFLTSQLLRCHTPTLVLPKIFCSFLPKKFSVFPFCHWQTLNNVTTQLSFNPFIRQCTLRRRASLTVKSAKWCFPAR